MAKRKSTDNQLRALPDYGQLVSIMQTETASILTDYIRQYIGVLGTNTPGSGIFTNFDRVLNAATYQELAWYDLYAEVERDPHVAAILNSAKLNVAGMPYDVDPYMEPGQKKATGRNQAIRDFVKDALDETGYFPQHLFNLMGALGMGFAVSEIVWKVEEGAVRIDKILNRPQRRFQFDAVDRSLKLRTLTAPFMGTALPEKKFIVHRCSAQWENPFGDALNQSLYWMWLFKRTVIKFWMQHLQVGAASVPIVKHPKNANPALKAEALEIAQQIRNGAYGRIPEGFEILWAEAANAISNADAYQNFIRACDDQMSKCVNGQTLTTEASSEGGKGTQALGTVHQGTMSSRDAFRAKGLASTMNETLIKWLVDFNFADVDGYPTFRFDLEDPENYVQEAQIVKTLIDSGYEIPEDEIGEYFNWTVKKKEKAPVPEGLQQVPVVGETVDEPEAMEEETKEV